MKRAAVVEAVLTASAGAALGAAVTSPFGLAVAGAAVAGVSGAIAGGRQIYEWRSVRGVAAFVLDSTWALASTASGLAVLAANTFTSAGYEPSLSRRHNRQVHRSGFAFKRGYAVTWGHVVNGAAGGDGVLSPRRARLVTDHEDVHVWQSRFLGPIYPITYVAWMGVAGMAAAAHWALRPSLRRRTALGKAVETWAYFANPYEWWAYSRDQNWPPRAVVAELAWKRPACLPVRQARWARIRALREIPTAPS